MKSSTLLLMALLLAAPLSGCLERSESNDECTVLPAGHDDDGVLRILTYDITALSEELTENSPTKQGLLLK